MALGFGDSMPPPSWKRYIHHILAFAFVYGGCQVRKLEASVF